MLSDLSLDPSSPFSLPTTPHTHHTTNKGQRHSDEIAPKRSGAERSNGTAFHGLYELPMTWDNMIFMFRGGTEDNSWGIFWEAGGRGFSLPFFRSPFPAAINRAFPSSSSSYFFYFISY